MFSLVLICLIYVLIEELKLLKCCYFKRSSKVHGQAEKISSAFLRHVRWKNNLFYEMEKYFCGLNAVYQ